MCVHEERHGQRATLGSGPFSVHLPWTERAFGTCESIPDESKTQYEKRRDDKHGCLLFTAMNDFLPSPQGRSSRDNYFSLACGPSFARTSRQPLTQTHPYTSGRRINRLPVTGRTASVTVGGRSGASKERRRICILPAIRPSRRNYIHAGWFRASSRSLAVHYCCSLSGQRMDPACLILSWTHCQSEPPVPRQCGRYQGPSLGGD